MNLQSTREGVTIALEALRSDKVRAFLTILGVGIGVATVTMMGAIMTGVEKGINDDLAAIGPENFVVSRFDQTAITISDGPPWEGKPKITLTEARALVSLPSVRSVTPAAGGVADMKVGNRELNGIQVVALGEEWPGYSLGDFLAGRTFLPADVERSAPVTVISEELATRAFGHVP